MTYKDVVNIIRNAANYVNPNGTFIHGRKSDGSLQYNDDTPQIILLEPQPNPSNNNQSYVETVTFPIIFVTQDSPESSNLEREDIKQDMFILSRQLLSKIDEQSLLQNVAYTNGQPEIRQLSGTMTGFSYSLQITYPLSECTLDYDLPPEITLFATETNVVAGTEIQIGWIANNVNSVTITPFGVLQGQFGFVDVTINSTTTFNGSATNSAGTATDTITITVNNGCDDATAVLKDTANNTISTTNIASGDTEDIIAPDGHVVLKKENDGVITNLFPRSGQTIQYQVDDSLITLQDTAGNTILTESVHATENETIVAPNATVQLKDTAGNNIGSADSYRSNSTNNKTAPDGSIRNSNSDDSYVNDVTVRSGQLLKANELPDITLVVNDQNGNNLLNVTRPSVKNLTETVTVPQILTWELNYNGTDNVIYIPATASNVGTLNSGTGSNVGTITVSTDGITYGALGFPFTPINGTTYYFKRGTASVNGTYTMVGTYV